MARCLGKSRRHRHQRKGNDEMIEKWTWEEIMGDRRTAVFVFAHKRIFLVTIWDNSSVPEDVWNRLLVLLNGGS